ncbi:MAG: DoxX family protein [Candidatus Promineifilaceae bacterium]|nr:DoxX family protein [Candidatus Promineifilaceae bacterium]
MVQEKDNVGQMGMALALLRITLGVIILVTWYDNLRSGLYTADGLVGFFNWLFDAENGNGSSLLFVKSYLDTFIVPIAGPFAAFQMIAELTMGLALLLGVITRLFSLAAIFFFINVLLSYFGGHEWIWTYVLLIMSAVTLLVGAAGRKWGIDSLFLKRWDEPQVPLLW